MLEENESILLIIDVQEKLVKATNSEIAAQTAAKLAKAATILDIPTIVTEQYPKGLGDTVSDVKKNLTSSVKKFEKTSFNAISENEIFDCIKLFNKKQVVLCGIETHICVYQSAIALFDAGFEVYLAKDACASRKNIEFQAGIERMQSEGVKISTLEIILFEWLKSAKHPHFKEIQNIIK